MAANPRDIPPANQSVGIDAISPWSNPYRADNRLDEEGKRSAFFDWIDRQPWFRDAMRRELTDHAITAMDPAHDNDAKMLDAAMKVCKGYPALHPIFVFGSNRSGRHGKGAAKQAEVLYGAKWGEGEGRQGQSYGLPTKDISIEALPLAEIKEHVERFIDYAREHWAEEFMLTRVGCGLAGHHDWEVGPLFAEAPANVFLPGLWEPYRSGEQAAPRIIVTGSRSVTDRAWIDDKLDRIFSSLTARPIIVSGGTRGPDLFGEAYALKNDLPIERFPGWWATERRAAGYQRNQRMSWRGSHLVAFWDGESPGTKGMIQRAREDGLKVKVVNRP